jgi:hypothetical protein
MKAQKLSVSHVQLEALPPTTSGELSDVFIRHCSFCCKKCHSNDFNRSICERMSGDDSFYCAFCLRNGFNTKNRKDVLILSFRAIIGWLYYYKYVSVTAGKIWFTELEDSIEIHRRVGLTNPAFFYDPETFLWFVNFARIGSGRKRQPIEDIHKTVINILACFNLSMNVPSLDTTEFFAKYRKSIDEFYEKRQRPKNKHMLIPTFSGCGVVNLGVESRISNYKLRNFDAYSFECKKST